MTADIRQIDVRHGDCLELLPKIEADSVRLVYLDPPFFTQKVQRLKTRDRTREFSYSDLWASHEHYAEFLYHRLIEIHRVLAVDGSIFFHCDRRASHIVRALLDQIFGSRKFRSEIIWHYRRWSNSQRSLLPAHQTIYFYSKTDHYTFNPVYVEYSTATNVDQILQRRCRDEHGKSAYERDASGRVVSAASKKGVPLGDVWDIPYLNPKARERVGYPTQKPVLLLERIIELVTDPGDLVVDPFCGSGTALVAASLLDRHAIGIDISEEAVAMTEQRLDNPVRTESALLDAGRESYRNADENSLAVLSGLDCVPVQRNKGIDAILVEHFRGRPVPVRVQRGQESVVEAARLLSKAGRSKHAQRMVLVVTAPDDRLDERIDLPPKVVLVESTAVRVAQALGKRLNTVGQLTLFQGEPRQA